jgi:hypothetical protein
MDGSEKHSFIVNALSFDDLLNSFVLLFKEVYGSKALNDINSKVQISNKCIGFLKLTKERKVRPGTYDFINVINSSSSFIFLSSEKKV